LQTTLSLKQYFTDSLDRGVSRNTDEEKIDLASDSKQYPDSMGSGKYDGIPESSSKRLQRALRRRMKKFH
jgi:hypothetical protein